MYCGELREAGEEGVDPERPGDQLMVWRVQTVSAGVPALAPHQFPLQWSPHSRRQETPTPSQASGVETRDGDITRDQRLCV